MLTYDIYLPEQRDILEYLLDMSQRQPVATMDFRINGNWIEFYRTINPWNPTEECYHLKWKWKTARKERARFYEVSGRFEEIKELLLSLECGEPEYLEEQDGERRMEMELRSNLAQRKWERANAKTKTKIPF